MKVTLHRKGSMGLMGVVTLKHGPNEVSPEQWDKVKDHPVVKDALRKAKNGGLTIEAQTGTPAPVAAAPKPPPVPEPEPAVEEETDPGRRLSAKDTIELVKNMGPDELAELEEGEDRKTVLSAIAARRDELADEE